MKFDLSHALAAVAVLALGYMIGQKMKASPTGAGQPGNTIDTQAEWWTYAGQWN